MVCIFEIETQTTNRNNVMYVWNRIKEYINRTGYLDIIVHTLRSQCVFILSVNFLQIICTRWFYCLEYYICFPGFDFIVWCSACLLKWMQSSLNSFYKILFLNLLQIRMTIQLNVKINLKRCRFTRV